MLSAARAFPVVVMLKQAAVAVVVFSACGLLPVAEAADPELSIPPAVPAVPPGLPARLLAVGTVPHDALDKEGETLGGFGSGLAADPGTADRYFSVTDRGPGDGTIDYRPRIQTWRINRDPADPARLRIVLEATAILTGSGGQRMTGLHPVAPGPDSPPLPTV